MSAPKSSHTPGMTATPSPAALTEDLSKSSAPSDAAVAETHSPEDMSFTWKNSIFPMVITVIAILPLALGMGTVRLKAAVSSARALRDEPIGEQHQPVMPVRERNDRRIGDQHFLGRRYEVAMQYYRSLGSNDPIRMPPELLYRIGLCQEALGLWEDALLSLRGVVGATDNPVLSAAAEFSQARIWLRLNEPGKAALVLRSLELHANIDRILPRTMSQDLVYLTPIAMAHEAVARGRLGNPFRPGEIGELFVWSLETALAWADEPISAGSPIADATQPVNLPGCRLTRRADRSADPENLDRSPMDVRCQQQSLRTIVERIAVEFSWKVDWTDLLHDPVLDQSASFAVENRPANSLLTVICAELQATWTLQGHRLLIRKADPDRDQTRRMIVRTLATLVDRNPTHRLADHCRYVQGQIAQYEGDLPQAAATFASLVGRDSSPLAIRAAYSAGTAYYQTGEFARACFQLRYIVNGAPGHELHTHALILLGRLLLDRGETQDAIFQLRRATEDRDRPEEQARAAAYLGLALMMQEKYQEAGEAILVHKFRFGEAPERNLAALVVSYSRWKSLTTEQKEREATYLYRALAAVKSEPTLFGQAGGLLIARVYAELGLEDQMVELYARLQAAGVTESVATEITCSLAAYESSQGRTDVARQMWTLVSEGPPSRWKNRAAFGLADLATKEHRPADCLQICVALRNAEGIDNKVLLILMGRAYEQSGDEVRAARCYAGQLPQP